MAAFTTQLNWAGPVNRLHPLNRNLQHWWMVVPGLTGGRMLIDINDPSNGFHGTLNSSMDPATDWVSADPHPPSGFGALDFVRDSQRVDMTGLTSAKWVGQEKLTLCALWKPVTTTQNGYIFNCTKNSNACWGLNRVGVSDIAFHVNTTGGFTQLNGDPIFPATVGLYGVHIGTYDGADMRLYWDGDEINSVAKTGTIAEQSASQTVGLGSLSDNSNGVTAEISSVAVINGALSAQEVREYTREVQQGFPGMLNRIEDELFVEAVAEGPEELFMRRNLAYSRP